MTTKNNLDIVKEGMQRFARGEAEGLLETFASDAQIVSNGPPGAVPWAGQHRGTEGVKAFFEAYDAVEYEVFEPLDFVASGDIVAVRGRERWRAKATGTVCDNAWVAWFTMRDGKAQSLHVYEDTAGVAQAVKGLALAPSTR